RERKALAEDETPLKLHKIAGRKNDVVVSGGGGLLQDKTSRLSLEYYLTVMRLAKLVKRRVIVYGQSLGPLSRSAERSMVPALRGIPIAVRDTRSQRYLLSHELSSTLVADPALLLEAATSSTSSEAKPLLIIPRGDQPDIQTALKQLVAHLSADRHYKHPLAVLALSPQTDAAAALALQQQGHSQGTSIQIWHADTPELASQRIAEAGAVLSVRLHGLILAAANSVPYSGVVYDPKVAAFLDETSAPRYHLPEDTTRLIEAVKRQPQLDWKQVDVLKARARDGLTWLNEQLEQ
ncbi:MAG: polysaccharide pyruvyl transferase family protein, partial [Deinococcota bacterium]